MDTGSDSSRRHIVSETYSSSEGDSVPKFEVEYSKHVMGKVVVEAENDDEAMMLVEAGDYEDEQIIDADGETEVIRITKLKRGKRG